MVNKTTVTSDRDELQKIFDEYDRIISELGSFWQGRAYENVVFEAKEFSKGYLAKINGQIAEFNSALDNYDAYLARVESDIPEGSTVNENVESLKATVELANKITNSLKNVTSVSLSAETRNYNKV